MKHSETGVNVTTTNQSAVRSRAYLLALVLLGFGGVLVVGGSHLWALGGSSYYGLAGLAICVSAVLIVFGFRLAVVLFWLMLLATVAWALWESGPDLWALAPRIALPLVFGAWLLTPWTWRKLPRGPPAATLGQAVRGAGVGIVVAVALGVALHAAGTPTADPMYQAGVEAPPAIATRVGHDAADEDWTHWGKDGGGSRFSSLDQIAPRNVGELRLAWIFRFGPAPNGAPATIEGTPLKIDNRVVACSDYNDIVALDAETGQQLWRFLAHVDTTNAIYGHCRGVGYYHVPGASGACAERIITNTIDARLIAVDAADGKLCENFGDHGIVDLRQGLTPAPKGYYYVTSAPTVARGRIIVGGWISDGQWIDSPSGVIRAFDAVTGTLSWAYDAGRPDRPGAPPSGEFYTRATPNSWGPMSADEALGLVYVPTGGTSLDYVGMQRRPFDETLTSSVAALDLETGRPRWTFQTTHHDLWDYDVGSQPVLIDWPGADGPRPALIQPTKRGEIFVLDRRTGQPILPVTEKPVPTRGAAPEERVSPTQPYSDAMPSFRGTPVTETSMWGLTPLDQLWCRIKFREARYDGPLTPPGITPSIAYPGFLGGSNWGSVSVDLDRHLMIVNSNYVGNYVKLIPRAMADAMGVHALGFGGEAKPEAAGISAQAGALYAVNALPFLSPIFAPCQQPPWGRISVVDLVTNKLIWSEPLGTARDSGPLGLPSMLPFRIGVPNLGGSITTRSGLTFIGAAQDNYLRAIDSRTGQVLWRYRLAAGGQATPMTYLSQVSQRQFVVVSAGGHTFLNTRKGDYIYAFALAAKE